MPNKTIYVTATDMPLFEEAARRAGGLSPAIATALHQYLATQGPAMDAPATETIELDVTEGPRTVRTRFQGRRIARLNQTHGLREVSYSIYRTVKNQYALYTVDRPDWQRWSHDQRMWEQPETWKPDFHTTHERSLTVFPTADELVSHLPDDLADAARRAMDAPAVHVLDI